MADSRREMVVGVSTFSAEDEARRLAESIAYWQAAGPRAIWDATCEITAEWFLLRGIDPAKQRVDKSVWGVLPAPWARKPELTSEEGGSELTL